MAGGEDGETPGASFGTWFIFWAIFGALGLFDVACLAPKPEKGSGEVGEVRVQTALGHTAFWFFVGIAFNAVVWGWLGGEQAVVWFNGYILEYMLSMDNVFFFQVVFNAYATPQAQVYKALFFGVLAAVVLRLLFYFVGAEFFRLAFVVQAIFGLVLIYSGYKTATSDDDEDDPRENRCIQCLTSRLPFIDEYDPSGALVVRRQRRVESPEATGGGPPEVPGQVIGMSSDVPDAVASTTAELGEAPLNAGSSHGTMLLLVVIVLGIVDLMFAVDSVSAKLAENDGVFVNFSSSAFAMLCLRSMYFMLSHLQSMFRLLKYGVAAILVMIGIKLIISHWLEIPSMASLVAIVLIFFVSMVLSAVIPEPEEYKGMEDEDGRRASVVVGRPVDVDPRDEHPSIGAERTQDGKKREAEDDANAQPCEAFSPGFTADIELDVVT